MPPDQHRKPHQDGWGDGAYYLGLLTGCTHGAPLAARIDKGSGTAEIHAATAAAVMTKSIV
jgi:hypothetical protein